MIKLGLVGRAISQSSSPDLHKLLGDLYGYELDYQLHEPDNESPAALQATLAELVRSGYRGCNVTYPYKQAALKLADKIKPSAALVGSTNTLLFGESIIAANTDYSGFIRGYRARFAEEPAGKVLLIGAGGVGRAIAFGLFEVGATEVFISDLDVNSAHSLAEAINAKGFKASVADKEKIADIARDVDGLVNCTPVGHYKSPGIPLDKELFGGQQWAFDAVYTPLDTEFLIEANRHGLRLMSGFDLFIYQGIDAFEIFVGAQVDAGKALASFQKKYGLQSELLR
ncbi:shikimate dehydrogenase family protein [Marinobacterium lutimaris]|uniref:Shikimate dehydrogenase n=1 Tax=Marinobacterium lutimaris TaxID=568106 RepID=A0A1H5TKM4_9GAMM|nr:shikimate dehydrogenase [Marinobacterium lutimaris]SEF63349.1 shikimate dehydrogenase [Marinobacterium lutimaris]